jgi:hypothetical protein
LIPPQGELASGDVIPSVSVGNGEMQVKTRHRSENASLFVCLFKTDPLPNVFCIKSHLKYKFLLGTYQKSLKFCRKAIFLLDIIIIIQPIEEELGGNILTFQFSSK